MHLHLMAAAIGLATLTLPATASVVACAGANVFATLTDGSTVPFSDCTGPIDGNLTGNPDNIDAITGSIASLFSVDVDYLGQSDGADFGPFAGTAQAGDGTLVLDQTLYGAFVFGLRGAKPGTPAGQHSLYAFDLGDLGAVSLHFDMSGTAVKDNGRPRDLSHAALYGSLAGPQSGPEARVGSVPEPSSNALVLLALAGIGLVARSRRR